MAAKDKDKDKRDESRALPVHDELIPAPPVDAERKDRLAAILRGESPGKGGAKSVSEKRKSNTQREKAERESMKKSLRGPRKRG